MGLFVLVDGFLEVGDDFVVDAGSDFVVPGALLAVV